MGHLISSTNTLTQGSIIDGVDWGYGADANPLSLVISNACDFAHDKIGFIIAACLLPAKETIVATKEFQAHVANATANHELKTKAYDSLAHLLTDYIYNKSIRRYFFIDCGDVLDCPSLVADFQQIKSIPFEEKDSLAPIAALQSPYIENLMLHFASYTARIPTDRDATEDELLTNLIAPYHKANK